MNVDTNSINVLEKRVADFLDDYNARPWAEKGKENLQVGDKVTMVNEELTVTKVVGVPEEGVGPPWYWLERHEAYQRLLDELSACREQIDQVRKVSFQDVDRAESSAYQLDQIAKVLKNFGGSKKDFYDPWSPEEVRKNVDLDRIPAVRRVVASQDFQRQVEPAETWAKDSSLSDKARNALLLHLLRTENQLTTLDAVELLQKRLGVFPGWNTAGTMKKSAQRLVGRYKNLFPSAPSKD